MAEKKNRCKKCQSFCMLGYQLVLNGPPDGATKNYPKGWQSWSNINKDSSIYLTLKSTDQNGLVEFITSAFYEGEINCSNLNDSVKDCKMWNKNGFHQEPLVDYPNCPKDVANGKVDADKIIRKKHFNSFLKQLTKDAAPVSVMGKGEPLHAPNNATSNGPIMGMQNGSETLSSPAMSPRNSYIEDEGANPTTATNKSLITHDLWKNLQSRASKLMYHPYQCNMCNIYEGGDFPEVVRELGSAIMENNPRYSWTRRHHLAKDVLGVSGIYFRQDCSGFVSACIGVYKALNYDGSYSTCDQVSGDFVSCSSALAGVQEDFCQGNQGGGYGLIFADSQHVEASDDEGKVWSGGGCGPGSGGECHEHPQMMHYGCGQKPVVWTFAATSGEGSVDRTGTAHAENDDGTSAFNGNPDEGQSFPTPNPDGSWTPIQPVIPGAKPTTYEDTYSDDPPAETTPASTPQE